VGAEDCLSKPFLLEELEYKVENLLNWYKNRSVEIIFWLTRFVDFDN
jgi:DNA-binding response OmpR family regulator